MGQMATRVGCSESAGSGSSARTTSLMRATYRPTGGSTPALGRCADQSPEPGEGQLRALRLVYRHRLARLHDLLDRADTLAAGMLGHHVRVGVEADRRVV